MSRQLTGIRSQLLKRCYHTRHCFGHRYTQYKATQSSIPNEWVVNRSKEANVWRLAVAYQQHGHFKAHLDPLGLKAPITPYPLTAGAFGFSEGDGHRQFKTEGILFAFQKPEASLKEITTYLEDTYCGTLAIETESIRVEEEREWLVRQFESTRFTQLTSERKQRLAELLAKSQTFDNFMAKKFGTVKRYGAEGGESLMAFFDEVLHKSNGGNLTDIILGMPHRGRLNLLVGLLKFSHKALFHKLRGNAEFSDEEPSSGDVLSHLLSSVDVDVNGSGQSVHVTMLPNPSHLETVNPVVLGKVRARQLSQRQGPYETSPVPETIMSPSKVLSLQVHGDASFAAQGVVMECLALASLPHFDVGGTLHLVVNNQLGFTTGEDHGRSSHHCSDVAKMIGAPVLHVNGDHPEEVVRAASIAMDYWLRYQKDIVVNMICFRKWGHNELDNPSLTQPIMYGVINSKKSVPDSYIKESGLTSSSDVATEYYKHLNQKLADSSSYQPPRSSLQGQWSGIKFAPDSLTQWDTGCPVDLLKYVGATSVKAPEEIVVNDRLRKSYIAARLKSMEQGTKIDWATAEALAIGTLLHQGFNVRLSGQDVGRGTFSHRHAMIVCQQSDSAYIPLNHLSPEQSTFLEVANSPLSEEAVLGFEYGFSIESPQHLVIWEAQFGDFANGAQVIFDTLLSCGEAKWLVQSGLVVSLPHGYDGAGPDHSSCRVERFLQMCDSKERGPDGDSVNMHVVHPTTPAQYYHLLRRQMIRNFRKPLIIQSPKILLRLPEAVSNINDMSPGTTFKPVLEDTWTDPSDVIRVVFCSGKHYYFLDKHRKESGRKDTALVRLELLCPFPAAYVHHELTKYSNAKEFIWSQEEPENIGPWTFVNPRFAKQLGCHLSLVSRKAYASSASGVSKTHQVEVQQLLLDTFKQ